MKEAQERDSHLLDYWNVLQKRRWVIYTSLTVLTVTVTLGSLLMRPIYTATTRLQIEPAAPNILPFQDVMATAPDQRNDFYQTQYGLIQSRRVAREVIASLGLDKHPDFKANSAPVEDLVEGKRIDRFLANLKVAPVRNSRLVDVSFSSHDRALAARAANRVADTYIAFNTKAEYNTSERATTSLTHQIANLQDEIDAKEKELQAYAKDMGIFVLNEKQNIILKNLNDMSDTFARAQADRIDKEARFAALRQASPVDLPEVMDSKLIQDLTAKSAELTRRHAELSKKYKSDWPEMTRLRGQSEETDARLQAERRSIYDQVLGAAESAYMAARNKETYLARAIEDLKRQSQEFGLKEIQYNNLKAQVANKRGTLEALVRRQSETSSSAGLNDLVSGNVRIVDPAELPARPSSPRILLNIFLSIVTGLGLGVGLAFFFEYLDKSVKTAEEMHEATGLPTIGLVPSLQTEGGRLRIIRANGKEPPPGVHVELISRDDPKSKIAEAFREIRTALLVSQPGGAPRTILIASTQPGEGKTAVSLNLAITLAQMGKRVLLVDGDLRRPRLHKLLEVENVRGLSNYLSGAGTIWPEPCNTGVPGLDIIPSGPIPPNPADLLDTERFGQLQSELEAHRYDHVIYDSPPILAVADPAIMAGRIEAVLVVVHAGVTGKDALGHAARKLAQVKAKVLGCVLNQVDLSQQGYYGYGYKRYYGEETDKLPAPRPEVQRRPPEQTLQG
ncbi:MAG TPA: polysaccharide biosynthesis tyrosine autokinase [Candidatus Polarisedimenticolia bacterium]|jgi:capsular exopolysaccharide synthesis family protein|nr:polysaccharide biosynthesis tyrosine autokinase [Candidatus Polarisedimenticolia bacterium]